MLRIWASVSFLVLAFTIALPTSYAKLSVLPKLRNREYREGEVIKSPMKSDPAIVCLTKNLLFWLNSIDRPARNTEERAPNFLSDYEYLSEKRYDNRLGKAITFFDKELDTRIYSSLTARPRPDGSIPIVDPDSKGLFIYIHGSGTNKASGANFAYKCTELSRLGYSCLSFDLPFHADGNQDTQYATTSRFMELLNRTIEKYKIPGQPVYLAGHSFGPDVVFEYIKRYPKGVDGVVGLSPAAFNKELKDWFHVATSQATEFWGDTRPNQIAGVWGGQATSGFEWNNPKSKLPDPTVVNPNLKVVALTGDWEEYAPGPMTEKGDPAKAPRTYDICAALRVYMKNIVCTREPEVGHYIFAKKDEYGNDIVMRELLRVTQPPAEMKSFGSQMQQLVKQLKEAADARNLSESEKMAQRYAREPFFKAWIDGHRGGIQKIQELLKSGKSGNVEAVSLQKQYSLLLQNRDEALLTNIINTKETAPDFYQANRELVDSVSGPGKNKGATDQLIAKYFDYLSKLSPSERSHAQLVSDSYSDISPEMRTSLEAQIQNSGKESSELNTAQKMTIELKNGDTFAFDPGIPPGKDQVSQGMAIVGDLRAEGRHREAQSILEWMKRWTVFKLDKDKKLSSWSYNSDAEEYLQKGAEAQTRPSSEEIERSLSEIEELRAQKKFREAEAIKDSLKQRGVELSVKKGKLQWSYSTP